MRRVVWVALRSAVGQYAKRGALGAGIGAIIGFIGALRAASEGGLPLADAELFLNAALAASVGCLAGLIFWHLRRLRERGELHYYLSWALSVGIAGAVFFLPEAVKTRDWLALIWVTGAGFFGGLGLAAYTRLILRDRS